MQPKLLRRYRASWPDRKAEYKIKTYLIDNPEHYHVLNSSDIAPSLSNLVDRHILDEIQHSRLEQPILVTNDKLFQLLAKNTPKSNKRLIVIL